MEAAHHDVKSELNQWHLEFITENDFSKMRKKYAADRVSVELRKFMNLKPNIEKLQRIVASMYRAHEEISLAW